jgi:hypothetical protein
MRHSAVRTHQKATEERANLFRSFAKTAPRIAPKKISFRNFEETACK